MGNYNEHAILSFFKGVLLKDLEKILVKPNENSRSARLIKLTNVDQIKILEPSIKLYIKEAIEIEDAGLKVYLKESDKLSCPEELNIKFTSSPEFQDAFTALTKGRQRGYILHFTGAKKSKTISSRIDKCVERIKNGYGFNDCICGCSKKMPNCDGSHKYL